MGGTPSAYSKAETNGKGREETYPFEVTEDAFKYTREELKRLNLSKREDLYKALSNAGVHRYTPKKLKKFSEEGYGFPEVAESTEKKKKKEPVIQWAGTEDLDADEKRKFVKRQEAEAEKWALDAGSIPPLVLFKSAVKKSETESLQAQTHAFLVHSQAAHLAFATLYASDAIETIPVVCLHVEIPPRRHPAIASKWTADLDGKDGDAYRNEQTRLYMFTYGKIDAPSTSELNEYADAQTVHGEAHAKATAEGQ